ncbi:hypothetical protein TYRP_013213 [Tyrophagus putrescentiae]|nr:hypothetical protein TYRP_013213 [Tyrophagus putrescentiae]
MGIISKSFSSLSYSSSSDSSCESLLGSASTELGHCESGVAAELLLAVVVLMTPSLGVTTSRNSFGSRSSSIFFICCSRIVRGNRKCFVRMWRMTAELWLEL